MGEAGSPLRNPVDRPATAVLALEGSPERVESLVGRGRAALRLIASDAPESNIGQSKVFPNDLDSILKAWALLAMVAAVDWLWSKRVGFTVIGICPMLCGLTMIAAAGIFFEFNGRAQWLSDIANYVALWESLALAINLYSYMVATLGFPMWDVRFARADAALGFNWTAGLHFIQAHPSFAYLLHYAYNSIFFQVLASIGFFAAIGRTDRNRELLWVAMVSALATTSLSGIFPALGPYIKEMPAWSAVLASIRAGTLSRFAITDMRGVVAFPSYHTVMAVYLVYAHRPPMRSFIPVAVLNAFMLVSIPFAGHHYLVDVISGTVVAMVSILIVRLAILPRRSVTAQNGESFLTRILAPTGTPG
jgi:PAP2 superfamily